MNNPYRETARLALHTIDRFTIPELREQALALVIAQAATKAQDGLRKRVWKLTMPMTHERKEVETLDNSGAFMRLEMAKAIGFAILDNDTLCELTREQDDDKVVFTASLALVPKEDWKID